MTGDDLHSLEKARDFAEASVLNARRNVDTIVFSAEPIYRHIDGGRAWQEYSRISNYWEKRLVYLNRLSGMFPEVGTEVLLYFRNSDSFLRSLRHELVKTGVWDDNRQGFDKAYSVLVDYDKQLDVFRSAFKKVTVFSYEKCTSENQDNSILQSFFDFVGTTLPGRSSSIWENSSS